MRRASVILFVFLLPVLVKAQKADSTLLKIESFIKQMTLEEKIGQMTQVTLAVVAQNGWGNTDGVLDTAALSNAIQHYKVGSILNTTAHGFSAETWRHIQEQIQDEARKTRLKIPIVYGLDGIHGQTYTLNSTLFRRISPWPPHAIPNWPVQ